MGSESVASPLEVGKALVVGTSRVVLVPADFIKSTGPTSPPRTLPVKTEVGTVGPAANAGVVIEAPRGLYVGFTPPSLLAGKGVNSDVGAQVYAVSLEKVTYCEQSVTVTGGRPIGETIVEQIAVAVGVYNVWQPSLPTTILATVGLSEGSLPRWIAVFPFGRMNGMLGAASFSTSRLMRLENAVMEPSGNFALAVIIELAMSEVVGRDMKGNASVLPDPVPLAKLRFETADPITDGHTVAIGMPTVVTENVLTEMLKLDIVSRYSCHTSKNNENVEAE